jgi:hypothetical protein
MAIARLTSQFGLTVGITQLSQKRNTKSKVISWEGSLVHLFYYQDYLPILFLSLLCHNSFRWKSHTAEAVAQHDGINRLDPRQLRRPQSLPPCAISQTKPRSDIESH